MIGKFLQNRSEQTVRFPAALFEIAKEDCGSESVEFALSFSLWIGAAFLIMYGSFALYAAHFVANAAEEACRYAMVRGSSWNGASCSANALDCTATSDDISSYVKSALPPGMSSANLSVSSSWPGTTASGDTCDTEDGVNSPNCIVKVTVTYQFTFPVPFFTQNTLPLKSTSIVTISQ
ncbi:pilus assembly protein [Telmatobacter sp. DSM 110680]|uniref:Pilus assembly protein n=1 Tax=Telmatobacter sp. DSM 110680 TaxID=3036704 RepID=A0AAU7DMP1_9BACT